MDGSNNELARLDAAARAVISEIYISRSRWWFLFVNLTLAASAFTYRNRFPTPLIALAFGGCAVAATVSLWTEWRYKIHALAIFFSSLFIGCVLLGRTFVALSDQVYGIAMSATLAFACWQHAGPFATVNRPEWEREQAQVNSWWYILTESKANPEIIEFSTKSFGSGRHTYRLLSVGPYWAIARLWKGIGRMLPNFRVRELSEVTFRTLPTGRPEVTIGNKIMRAENLVMPEPANATKSSSPNIA